MPPKKVLNQRGMKRGFWRLVCTARLQPNPLSAERSRLRRAGFGTAAAVPGPSYRSSVCSNCVPRAGEAPGSVRRHRCKEDIDAPLCTKHLLVLCGALHEDAEKLAYRLLDARKLPGLEAGEEPPEDLRAGLCLVGLGEGLREDGWEGAEEGEGGGQPPTQDGGVGDVHAGLCQGWRKRSCAGP